MVQYSNNDQTSLKNDSGGNEQTVDKDQVQQWVDRAIGNIVTNKNQSIAMIQDDTGFLPSVTPTEFSNLQGTSMQSLIANSITTKLTGRSPSMSSSALKATIENPDATQTDFDRALAGELNQLSFEERERTWDEIHGVAPMEKESPEFLDSKLFDLQNAIFHIPHDQKKYYVEALNDPKGKVYVTSSNFQLQFLRAERFDAIKAATRLVLCCEKKVQFFGRQALVRPLQLSDLDAEEQKTLKGGAFQVLPQRDQSGRLIVIDTSLCGPKLYTNLFAYVSNLE